MRTILPLIQGLVFLLLVIGVIALPLPPASGQQADALKTCRADLQAQIARFQNCQADSVNTFQLNLREMNQQVQEALSQEVQKRTIVEQELTELRKQCPAPPATETKQ